MGLQVRAVEQSILQVTLASVTTPVLGQLDIRDVALEGGHTGSHKAFLLGT